ncbi:hypothetical protein VHEMI02359 [[Torrubiella] hemipterigena]|uniref:Glutathione S-transferase n=1 Tax=[Torrubiella] hemipterigena TaxID=1531966 RepID=A0A0A1SPE5_9HYPO|nr:hypothetical protein VHEMI02359 [[Torrubiella] hemipterigena]
MSSTTLHYLDIGAMGRGEVIRVFLQDAGIEYKDVRYKFDATWPASQAELKAKGISKTGRLPSLEYNGQILSQHVPIMRYFSRKLNKYDGATDEEKYEVDLVSDLYVDWRAGWAGALGASDEVKEAYAKKTSPQFWELVGTHYDRTTGPFLLGDDISYADFAVYQAYSDDSITKTIPETLPASIIKFKEAFEARPTLAAYLKDRK